MNRDVVIVAAKRTPQGKFLGALSKRSAVELAVAAGRAALAGLHPEAIEEVILGNVLSAGQGMNPARQVAIGLGLPIATPAATLNVMCGSGLEAVAAAARAIRCGDRDVVLCGGTESMSNAPHLLMRSRLGHKLGDAALIDSMMRDGLTDPFSHEPMGMTAELLAEEADITRAMQDNYAAQSQHRAAAAQDGGVFEDELVAVEGLTQDEHPRRDTSAESLGKLKPAFRTDGTVTAGNAAGINDGAAVLVLASREAAERNGWKPLAKLEACVSVGCDPARMGLGPVAALRKLSELTKRALHTLDQVEINEAFAAQVLACAQQLQLDAGSRQLNPHGGGIALGHPIGASGARLLTHLAHRVAHGHAQHTAAALCVGGGMGVAAAVAKAE